MAAHVLDTPLAIAAGVNGFAKRQVLVSTVDIVFARVGMPYTSRVESSGPQSGTLSCYTGPAQTFTQLQLPGLSLVRVVLALCMQHTVSWLSFASSTDVQQCCCFNTCALMLNRSVAP